MKGRGRGLAWIAGGCGCLALIALASLAAAVRLLTLRREGEPPVPRPTRGVLIVAIDDLRADHLRAHGYGFDTAPNLTRLAEGGVVFEGFVTSSSAANAAVASLLTGELPTTHGLASARDVGRHRLPGSAQTLAEILRARGWRTIAAVSLRQLEARLSGLDQGFDLYLDGGLPRSGRPLPAAELVDHLEPELERMLRGGEPVFAFVHLGDLRETPATGTRFLHEHLRPFLDDVPGLEVELARARADPAGALSRLEELIGRRRGSPEWKAFRDALYDAQLHDLDRALGRLLDLAGLETVVVLGTRGGLLHEERPPDGIPEAFSEGRIRTALIVRLPETADPRPAPLPRRRSDVAQTVDLAPSLLALLGCGGALSPRADGRDLELLHPRQEGRPSFACVVDAELATGAVVGQGWKFLFPIGSPQAVRLFERSGDTEVDPGELPSEVEPAYRGWSSAASRLPRRYGVAIEARSDPRRTIRVQVRSPRGELTRAEILTGNGRAEARVSRGGARAQVVFPPAPEGTAVVEVGTSVRGAPLVFEVLTEGEPLAGADVRVGEWALDARPIPWLAFTGGGDGGEAPAASLRRTGGGWREVRVDGRAGEAVRLHVVPYPPAVLPGGIELRPGDGTVLQGDWGPGGVVLGGESPLRAAFRLKAGERPALAIRLGTDLLPPDAIGAEGGEGGLVFYLPSWLPGRSDWFRGRETSAFEATGGALRFLRLDPARVMDGPIDLEPEVLGFLRRLGRNE